MSLTEFFVLGTLLTIPNGLGVNIHFTGEQRDLDLIAEAGFKFIRMDFGWGSVERTKGVYNFTDTGYDALTEGCLKRGIHPLYILDYSNRLYEPETSVRSAEGRKAFADFASSAVKRYEGKEILWEIWNEPNIQQFWKPQPSYEDYTALVEETAVSIKKAVPSALVVAPATSGIPFEWLEECFKRGLLKWIDALTVHPYRAQKPETVIKDYEKLRNLIKHYAPAGKEIPIISGEWGYSLINWNKARLPEEQQAQYLVREFLVNLYQGIVVNIWYDWKDDGTDPNEREHNFGTMTHDLKPKQAYLAAKALMHLLNGYSVVERLNLDKDEDFALRLKKGNDEAIAFWTTGEKHEVKLPIIAKEGFLYDMFGEKKGEEPKDKTVTLLQSPQYLLTKIE